MDDDIYGIKKWGNDILEVLENGNIGLKNPFYHLILLSTLLKL